MSLAPGTRLGAYEIASLLGAGGMGEVYRARDTRLNRDVAIKILPEAFVTDPDRVARFQREAQVLASLNHPNVAQIYGLEQTGDSRALVLELVDGPTLADRIAKGPVPVDEVLPIAKQIAEALEAAHEHGIIHRDLKPANIKLRPDGTVKVLDFGLAKALDVNAESTKQGPPYLLSQSPTITSPANTIGGVILGTAAYMSPEQARGKAVDKRADIWAFGCVLYEMLTGTRVFAGEDVTETMAFVLTREVDWSVLPAAVPAAVTHLAKRCLARDPGERLRDIGEARIQLSADRSNQGSLDVVVTPVGSRQRLPWLLASAFALSTVLLGVTIAYQYFAAASDTAIRPLAIRSVILLPKEGQSEGLFFYFHISPDARYIAASGVSEGAAGIFVREFDSWEWRLLPGTTTGAFFWSPDSRYIGFFDNRKVKKVNVTGGPPEEICDAGPGFFGLASGTWGKDGVIVFAPARGGSLLRVPASGGKVEPLTAADRGVNHVYPVFLPDGQRFLYTVKGGSTQGIYVGSFESPAGQRLVADVSSAQFAATTFESPRADLIFMRDGKLMAQRLDHRVSSVEGEPVVIAERALLSDNGAVAASVSENGVLAYLGGSSRESDSRLAWFDRSGRALAAEGPRGAPSPAGLSSDDNTAAILRRQPGSLVGDLWLRDLRSDVGETRLTFDNTVDNNGNIVWSPDGTHIAFSSMVSGGSDLFVKDVRAATPAQPIVRSANRKLATQWSQNGLLVYTEIDPTTGSDLWYVRVDQDSTGTSRPVKFLQTEFEESFGEVSPDGRWITYVSNESGRYEIYVRPFPAGGEKWKVSPSGTASGTTQQPRWSRDGKELFYVTGSGGKLSLMVTTVRSVPPDGDTSMAFQVGVAKPLFDVRVNAFAPRWGTFFYAASRDGQRFLINHVEADSEPVLNVVVNWERTIVQRN